MLKNADSYGHEKLQGEELLLKELPPGRKAVVLRLPDVIGPFDSTHRLWAYWHWLRVGEIGAPPPQIQSYKRKRTGCGDLSLASRCRKKSDADGTEIAQATRLKACFSQVERPWVIVNWPWSTAWMWPGTALLFKKARWVK